MLPSFLFKLPSCFHRRLLSSGCESASRLKAEKFALPSQTVMTNYTTPYFLGASLIEKQKPTGWRIKGEKFPTELWAFWVIDARATFFCHQALTSGAQVLVGASWGYRAAQAGSGGLRQVGQRKEQPCGAASSPGLPSWQLQSWQRLGTYRRATYSDSSVLLGAAPVQPRKKREIPSLPSLRIDHVHLLFPA